MVLGKRADRGGISVGATSAVYGGKLKGAGVMAHALIPQLPAGLRKARGPGGSSCLLGREAWCQCWAHSPPE